MIIREPDDTGRKMSSARSIMTIKTLVLYLLCIHTYNM